VLRLFVNIFILKRENKKKKVEKSVIKTKCIMYFILFSPNININKQPKNTKHSNLLSLLYHIKTNF
jgi:hypothetical protein